MKAVGLLLVFSALVPMAWGQQTYFRASDRGNARIFDYRWQDGQKEQAMKFSLNLEDIAQAAKEFQPFDNNAAQSVAFKAVQAEAGKLSTDKTKVEVARHVGGYDIRARGPVSDVEAPQMEKIAENLRVVRDQALEEYVTQKFYSRIDDVHIMPDHKRIAQRYAVAMAPLVTAARNAMTAQGLNANDPRVAIDYLLHFFQSIPYDELQSRYTSNGAGFETPYTILSGNKGDCDSKSVALAATLRQMFPNLRLTMVYVPEHAFVGIALPQGGQDYALKLGSSVFVLADPTGPKLMNLGEVAEKALASLNGGKFSYQEVLF